MRHLIRSKDDLAGAAAAVDLVAPLETACPFGLADFGAGAAILTQTQTPTKYAKEIIAVGQ